MILTHCEAYNWHKKLLKKIFLKFANSFHTIWILIKVTMDLTFSSQKNRFSVLLCPFIFPPTHKSPNFLIITYKILLVHHWNCHDNDSQRFNANGEIIDNIPIPITGWPKQRKDIFSAIIINFDKKAVSYLCLFEIFNKNWPDTR